MVLLFVASTVCIVASALAVHSYRTTDQTQPADVAIVLGYSLEDGQPSPAFRERIHHAIGLYHQGYVSALILTGGTAEGDPLSEAQAAKNYALTMGVPESAILLEDKSRITQENLRFSKEIMEEKGFSTALIVSDPLHMRRAMLMAKDQGITAFASPTTTSVHRSPKLALPFIARESVAFAYYNLVRLFA